MFNFFEKIIEGIGFKIISDFNDKVFEFIKNVNKEGSNNNEKVATSGYYSKVATSGNYSQVAIEGENSVGFACGLDSIIKAKKGTWISLCEYAKDEDDGWIPIYALSAQIGNKDYKDFKGRMLKENEFYCLVHKNFYPVDLSDGIKTIKVSEKKRKGITIIKGLSFNDYETEVYVVKEGELSAHGSNLKEALEDLQFKKLRSEETQNIVKEIKESGKVTRMQYRTITGACQFGTEQFCKVHGIEDLEEIEIEELRKILINDYGAKKFWKLVDKV